MLEMWDVRDVGCSGCRMLEMWDVGSSGCGMFAGMWDVDLQNALLTRLTKSKMQSVNPIPTN